MAGGKDELSGKREPGWHMTTAYVESPGHGAHWVIRRPSGHLDHNVCVEDVL